MKIIDRYIAGTFVSSYILLIVGFIAIIIFGDILANFDEFTKDRALTLSQILRNMVDYYGHNLPLYYHQLGGAMLAIAAGFTFAVMLHNNELTAIVAAGVPLQRLAAPALVSSLVLVAAWIVNAEVVVPHFAQKIVRMHDDLNATRTIDVQCVRDDRNAILTAEELHLQQGWMKGVHIVEADQGATLRPLIRADVARWDPERRIWLLDRGLRQVMLGGAGNEMLQTLQWEPIAEYEFSLAPEDILLRQSAQWADLMSTRQMNALLKSRNLPNLPTIERARDVRFTQPWLACILMLLSLPFFLTREPANVLVAGAKALTLCGVCFALIFLAQNVAAGSYGRLGTALPVLVFGPIAVLHVANVRT